MIAASKASGRRGVVPGAITAALLFPTLANVGLLVYAIYVGYLKNSPIHVVLQDAFSASLLLAAMFLIFAIFWGIGISLVLIPWEFVHRHVALGPLAAAAVGAFAALGIFLALSIEGSAAPLLEPVPILIAVNMALAGALGGAAVWWMAYRPEVVRSRLQHCPICRHKA